MGVTIRDVARLAGVSPTTVSRVFNETGLVRDETRAHVLDVAARLRYVPNAAARGLSLHRADVLGLVLPFAHSEFFMEMIRGMDEAALEVERNLLISGSHNRVEDTLKAFSSMKGKVDGFLIVSPNLDLSRVREALPEGVPALFLHGDAPADRYHAIRLTNEQGAFEAARHLLELGHRRIAVITGPEVNQEAAERLAGFRRALCSYGEAPDPDLVIAGDFTRESGVAAAWQVLALPQRPTAVFAFSDLMAIGVLGVFRAAGVRVPDDIALVGFDDIPSARYVTPSLTTVRVPIYEMGRRAVFRLVEMIDGDKTADGGPEIVSTTLVPRASTLGPAYREELVGAPAS